jgi:phage baseplate assembly protein W
MNPEFGSRVKDLVFENNTDVLKSLLRYHIGKALERWEPRIQVTSILFPQGADESTVPVSISYRVIRSQVDGNLVYPFVQEIRE